MKRTILVVEDDGYIADVLKSLLEANDYRVLSAMSGEGALQLAASHVPDVILLDLGLPDIDGTRVLTRLRGWYEGPIIIVSARNQEKEKASGRCFANHRLLAFWGFRFRHPILPMRFSR